MAAVADKPQAQPVGRTPNMSYTTQQVADGYIYAVQLDFSGVTGSDNVDVDIVTWPSGITVLSIDDVSTDAWYYPRDLVDSTAGVVIGTTNVVQMPLINDRIILSVYDAASNGLITVNAKLYFDKAP